MGKFNSSITRVWPVFDFLLGKDSTGISWLSALFGKGSKANKSIDNLGTLLPKYAILDRNITGSCRKDLGKERAEKIGKIRHAFEYDLSPANGFLKWLIKNPNKIEWPKEKKYSPRTQKKREELIKNNDNTKQEALDELHRLKSEGSWKKWWAFEGYTSVDCMLETEKFLLLIEGKRTEPISSSTVWFPKRNQIVRNLECAKEIAEQKHKEYSVLICAEEKIEISDNDWKNSLPHFNNHEIENLKRHYFGYVTWDNIVQNLCPDLQLPDNVDEAFKLLKKN